MAFEAISIIASVLIILGYLPEFYELYKTKEAKIGNAYIWIIWTTGSLLALLYGTLNEQYYLIATQITVFLMNILTLLSKIYYIYCYKLLNKIPKEKLKSSDIISDISNDINSYNDIGIDNDICIDIDIDNDII
jgi:uncharacterized protein with PQ loop repeat